MEEHNDVDGERKVNSDANLHHLPHRLGDDGELISPIGIWRRFLLSPGG
jgi:hypothetical protein